MKNFTFLLVLVAFALLNTTTGQSYKIVAGETLSISVPGTVANQDYLVQRTYPADPSYAMVTSNGGELEIPPFTIHSSGIHTITVMGSGKDKYAYSVNIEVEENPDEGFDNTFKNLFKNINNPETGEGLTVVPALSTSNVATICEGGKVIVSVTNTSSGVSYSIFQTFPSGNPASQTIPGGAGTTITFDPFPVTKDPLGGNSTIFVGTGGTPPTYSTTFNVDLVAQPDAPVLNALPASPVCQGTDIDPTLNTAGSGGTSDCDDRYEYNVNGGSWNPYLLGDGISTTGLTFTGGTATVSVKAIRDNQDCAECDCYDENVYSWTVHEQPTIDAGPDLVISTGATSITMTGQSYTGATGADWSGGNGSWSGDVYTIAPADIAAGSVIFTYSTNSAAPCAEVNDNVTVDFLDYVVNNTSLTGDLNLLTAAFPPTIPPVIVDESFKINSRFTLDDVLPTGTKITIIRDGNTEVSNWEPTTTGPFWYTDLTGATPADFDGNYANATEEYEIIITSSGNNPQPFSTDFLVESVISNDDFTSNFTVLADITLGISIPDEVAPVVDEITPADESYVAGETEFIFDFFDANTMAYLELDIYRPGDDINNKIQLTLPADDAAIEAYLSANPSLETEFGLMDASYNATDQSWSLTINTAVEYGGDFVWPDGITKFYMEAADVAGNQYGDMNGDPQWGGLIYVQYTFDNTDPVFEGETPLEGSVTLTEVETFVWTIDASDANLYELEIDHSLEGTLDEFSVYASESDPYGGQGAAFAAAGVTVTYDGTEQVWTIDFGTVVTDVLLANGGITFYIVLKDYAGNQWGTMSGTTPENTFVYTINQVNIYNVTQGLYYPTIQAAIDDANPSDVIEVAAGTYTENVTISNINGLTILGPNAGLNDAKGTRVTEAIVVAAADAPVFTIEANVTSYTINGFNIVGADYNSGSNGRLIWSKGTTTQSNILNNKLELTSSETATSKRYIWLGPATSGNSGANYISGNVKYNHFKANGTGNRYNGIITQQSPLNLEISYNWFEDMRGQRNILVWHPSSTTFIIGNDMATTGYSDVIWLGGPGAQQGNAGVVIQDNKFSSEGIGVGIHSMNYSPVITGNSFADVTYFAVQVQSVSGSGGTVDATCNWYGTKDLATVVEGIANGNVNFLPYLVQDAGGTVTPSWSNDTYSCNGQGPVQVYTDETLTTLVSSHLTIQDGIDAASAGYYITVDDGPYEENLVFDKPIQLSSVGGASNTSITGTGGTAITVNADNVKIDGFTITNPDGQYGIYMDSKSGLQILNNHIHDVGINNLPGTGEIVSVNILNAGTGVNVEGNKIKPKRHHPENYEACIRVDGGVPGEPVVIHDNTLEMDYDASYSAGATLSDFIGIDLVNGAQSTITENDIKYKKAQPDSYECSIRPQGPGAWTIKDNTLWDGDINILVSGGDVTINGNDIQHKRYQPENLEACIKVDGPLGTPPAQILNNTIEMDYDFENGFTPIGNPELIGILLTNGAESYISGNGIKFKRHGPDSHEACIEIDGLDTGSEILNNTIEEGDYGIHILNDATALINENAILNNAIDNPNYQFGIVNGTTDPIDATCNWWGDEVASNVADRVSGDIQFLPFLIVDNIDGDSYWWDTGNSYSCEGYGPVKVYSDAALTILESSHMTIQDGIDAASTGYYITVDDGTYYELVDVHTSVTLIGNGGDPNTKPIVTSLNPINAGPNAAIFTVSAPDVVIENFEMRIDRDPAYSGYAYGVYAPGAGTFDGLTITDNLILQMDNAFVWTNNAIFLGDEYVQGKDEVSITGNTIAANEPTLGIFGKGIRSVSIWGSIEDNEITAWYTMAHAVTEGGVLDILNNTTYGWNEINLPKDNTLTSININGNDFYQIPGTSHHLLEVKKNKYEVPINVTDNDFFNFTLVGMLSSQSKDITLTNNRFTPDENATDFISVFVNTKQATAGVEPNNFSNSIKLYSNTFNGPANIASGGTGILFADHAANDPEIFPPFANVVIGDDGSENIFDSKLATYIGLDPYAGSTATTPPWNAFWGAEGPEPYPTIMAPVGVDFDASQNTFAGKEPSAMTLSELFALEDKITHEIDYASLGFVTVVADNDYVTENSFVTGFTTAGSIQRGIEAASAGWTVNINAGTFTENIVVNKQVALLGSGSGDDPLSNTIITQTTGNRVIEFTASGTTGSPILLQDIRVIPNGSLNALEVHNGENVSYLTLENVWVVGPIPATIENQNGFKVATDGSLSYLTINNSAFNGCDYGWYFAKHGDWGPGGSNVTNVTVTNSHFDNNSYKAIYVEKLSQASFTTTTFNDNGSTGFWNEDWNGGVDINLKGEEMYQNISFVECTVTGNGLSYKEGAGMMIKARDDGATYGAHAASLDNVTITGCTITGNERGIRFGEPGKNNATPTNVTVENCNIYGNVQQYSGVDGSAYGGLINMTSAVAAIDASPNWWGYDSGPAAFPYNTCGLGDAIEGNVDYVPWSGSSHPDGLPLVSSNPNQTVHNTSLIPNTSYCSIQDAIDDPATLDGHTIYIENGLYIESNILVDKQLTIYGESKSGVIIAPAAEDVGSGTSSFDGTYQNAFMVVANGVTIKDLTIDGTANNLTNGGTLPDHYNYRIGILNYADGDEGYNNLTVQNVDIYRVRRRGIALWPASTSGHLVSGCTIRYVEYQQAIMAAGPATITGNTISHMGSAISLFPSETTPSSITFTVTDNIISHIAGSYSQYYGHSWPSHAFYYRNPNVDQTVIITGNTISIGDGDEEAGLPGVLGMYVYNADASSLIQNNTINSTGGTDNWGIYLGGCAGTTVNGNTFIMNEKDRGIYLGRGNPTTPVPNIITNNDFTSTASVSTDLTEGCALVQGSHGDLFWMVEDPENTNNLINGNKIDGFVTGILLHDDGVLANTVDATIYNNSITNSTLAIDASTLPNIIDASFNYYGETDPTTVGGLISAQVDYSPWLGGGTYNTPGFSGNFATLYVDDDSEIVGTDPYIKEGIDKVVGSTVYVAPGTYEESVVIDKSLDLLSTGDATDTKIDVTGLNSGGILITASNVTIDGFEIEGDHESGWGVYVAAGANDLSDIDILNNDIHGMARPHATSMAAKGILVDGKDGTNIGSVTGLTIDGNTISDIGNGTTSWGIAVSLHEITGATAGDGALVTDNDFDNIADLSITTPIELDLPGFGIQVGYEDPINNTGVSISGNTYTNMPGGIFIEAGNSSINEDASDMPGVLNYVTDVEDKVGLSNIVLNNLLEHAITDKVTTLLVTGSGTAILSTITHAIEYSDPGATVTVGDGTYNETLVIDKGLSLVSANGAASATIAGSGGTVISVGADAVTIYGFTITNPNGSNAIVSSSYGSLKVQNNIITAIGNNLTSGNTHAIAVSSNSNAIDDIQILNNQFSDIHGGNNDPVIANGSASAIGIGWSDANYEVTGLVIKDNVISQVYASDLEWVTGNQGGKGAYGIIINTGGLTGSGFVTNASILNNEISDLSAHWSHGIGLEGNTPGAQVKNNKIYNLSDTKPTVKDAAAIMIEDNSGTGLVISDNSFSNDFTISVDAGIRNVTTTQVDVTCNWFGTDVPAEIQGLIDGPVNVSSYLLDGGDNTLLIGFQPTGSCGGVLPVTNISNDPDTYYGTIQAAVDAANPGDAIVAAVGTYPENVSINIEGISITGADKATTFIDGGGAGTVVTIEANEVGLSGFTIQNSGVGQVAGVALFGANDCNISGNNITTNQIGLAILGNASGNTVQANEFTNNTTYGVLLDYYAVNTSVCTLNLVIGNTTISGSEVGIYLGETATGNTLSGNTITGNSIHGIELYHADGNFIQGNTINSNTNAGIRMAGSKNNTINGVNIITGGAQEDGIRVFTSGAGRTSDGNLINKNRISGHDRGVVSDGITVDATLNYWGVDNGPGHPVNNTCGTGNLVSDHVEFFPWHDDETMNTLYTLPVPTFTIPADQVVCADETTNDTYTVSGTGFDATATLNCRPIQTIVNDQNSSATLNGNQFNTGLTTVTWTVTDVFGNVYTNSDFDVTVNPLPDPNITGEESPIAGSTELYSTPDAGNTYDWEVAGTPIPSTGVPTAFTGGTATVNPGAALIEVSWDINATGSYTVSVTETTGDGCWYEDEVTVNVQAIGLYGTITYKNAANTPMGNVTVQLLDNTDAVIGTPVTTDPSGYFEFTTLPTGAAQVEVSTVKAWGGGNSTDALAIQREAINIIPRPSFWDPEVFIDEVGDVNNNGLLNATDALKVRHRAIQLVTSFAAGDWAFFDPAGAVNFTNTDAFTARLDLPAGNTLDIQALCYGDVNGSFTPSSTKNANAFNNTLHGAEVMTVAKGSTFELPVRVDQDINFSALTLYIKYEESKVAIQEIHSALPGFDHALFNDFVNVAWSDPSPVMLEAGDELVTLVVTTMDDVSEDDLVFFLGSNTEFADAECNVINDYKISIDRIDNSSQASIDCFPNPFTTTLNVSYALSEAGSVRISLMDNMGSAITVLADHYHDAGSYAKTFDAREYGLGTGVYYLRMEFRGANTEYTELIKVVYTK